VGIFLGYFYKYLTKKMLLYIIMSGGIINANTIINSSIGNTAYDTAGHSYGWPITIQNGATVKIGADITLSTATSYFILGSTATIDGSANTIEISGVNGYPGLVQNGTLDVAGFNCTIQNIGVDANTSPSGLTAGAGWIGQYYFSKGATSTIQNCWTNGVIGTTGVVAGGICGTRCGARAGNTGNLTIQQCYTTGSIINGGGICANGSAYNGGKVTIINCYTTGYTNVGVTAGGILGTNIGVNDGNVIIENCYVLGITGQTADNVIPGLYLSAGLNSNITTTQNYVDSGSTWNSTNANLGLTGVGTVPPTLGQVWVETGPTAPFTLAEFYTSPPCFKEGTKILTDKGYKLVEELRKGDLVKTVENGFLPIFAIGKKDIYQLANKERVTDQLYKCSPTEYPELIEDLIITGAHSILVDELNKDQVEKIVEILGDIYITGNKYRLPACLDNKTTIYDVPGTHTIYHFALENDDYYFNYGIYANGLLVETCSKRYLIELSNMNLLE